MGVELHPLQSRLINSPWNDCYKLHEIKHQTYNKEVTKFFSNSSFISEKWSKQIKTVFLGLKLDDSTCILSDAIGSNRILWSILVMQPEVVPRKIHAKTMLVTEDLLTLCLNRRRMCCQPFRNRFENLCPLSFPLTCSCLTTKDLGYVHFYDEHSTPSGSRRAIMLSQIGLPRKRVRHGSS